MAYGTDKVVRLGSLLGSRNGLIRDEACIALSNFPITNRHVVEVLRNTLQSTSWDARGSAAEALRLILKNVPLVQRKVKPNSECLASLDLRTFVQEYHPLLSCEDELINRIGECSYGEQLKIVNEQLEYHAITGMSALDFLSDDDFRCYSSAETRDMKSTEKVMHRSVYPSKEYDISSLSKNFGSPSPSVGSDEFDIAIHLLVTQLMQDLLDAKWEIRHGAALALSTVLEVLPTRLSSNMVDILTTRLFQAIALDNFIDFSSGRSAVGPVREAVSECIARMIMAFPFDDLVDTMSFHIVTLHSMNEEMWRKNGFDEKASVVNRLWFHRQAALLIIKYHFAGPYYHLNLQKFYEMLLQSFEDVHDEVCASSISAITALFCKENIDESVQNMLRDVEKIIFRFIDSACNNASKNQLMDIDTVAIDLLSLLVIWLKNSESSKLPYSVLRSLSRILNPLHLTRSQRTVDVFSTSFSRLSSLSGIDNDIAFEDCSLSVLSSLLSVVLFAAPQDTEDLIESCINCSHHIGVQIAYVKRLPNALVETIGRWSACLLIDARTAEIDFEKCNVSLSGYVCKSQRLCGEEIRTLGDMDRLNILLTRKMRVAQFLAPLFSVIYNFPAMIGNQSFSDAIQFLISPLLNSLTIMHRLGGLLLCHSWFTYSWKLDHPWNAPAYLADVLHNIIMSTNVEYDDEKTFVAYLDSSYKEFSTYCKGKGVSRREIDDIENHGSTIDGNAEAIYNQCYALLNSDEEKKILTARFEGFKNAVATSKAIMTSNISRINALAVSSLLLIYPQILLETPSYNPFIKPLMEFIRFEDNETVAKTVSNCFTLLFRMTSEKSPNPHPKMIKQLVVNLTSCSNRFPEDFESVGPEILPHHPVESFSVRSKNAECVLRILVGTNSSADLATLLDFNGRTSVKEFAMYLVAYGVLIDECRKQGIPIPEQFKQSFSKISTHLASKFTALRHSTVSCLREVAKVDGMLEPLLADIILPLQQRVRQGEADINTRSGLVELLFVLSELGLEAVGGLRVLAPLALRMMADNCEIVRKVSAAALRNLVPLMALRASNTAKHVVNSTNDLADKNISDCVIDLLLGDPDQLTRLPADAIRDIRSDVVLRQYQEEGIRWLSLLEDFGIGGILADDMGLGKTLETLCLLSLKLRDNKNAKVLIICPPTLIKHWCAEWTKYFPSLAPFHRIEEGIKEKEVLALNPAQQVIVASYNTVRSATAYFQAVHWYYVILDEGHVIRNPATQNYRAVISLRAQNRLVLSGTPVQNSPSDLWALFQFVMPGYLGTMKEFRMAYLNAINISKCANATAREIKEGQNALERLHKAVLPFVLRRLKCDVLKDLPEKIVQDYMCTMTSLQERLYTHIVNMCQQVDSVPEFVGGSLTPLETISELRKCIVHPSLVSISCLQGSGIEVLQGSASESGKLIALRELLKECGIGAREQYYLSEDTLLQESEMPTISNHRALIFCQRISSVNLLAKFFDTGDLGKDIRYAVLDGTVPVSRRHAVAEAFNCDPSIHVLILTTSVGGEGLNLVGADIVIFLEHDWNPVRDLQAMDRAHRIGQKCTVNVYRLIMDASIEEKIMRLQKFKVETANALVGSDNRSLQTMATEQLVDLLTNDTTRSSSSRESNSRVRRGKRSINSTAPIQKETELWNIEELWDMSQYDRYNVPVIVRSFAQPSLDGNSQADENTVRKMHRHE